MKKLREDRQGFLLYNAGFPKFQRNFTRDSIISAILTSNPKMLSEQLKFCSLKQGRRKNPFTGEEPGKIFHEYPEVISKKNNLSTKYNACDTTALYLIGHKKYFELTKDKTLLINQKKNILKAIEYITSHIKNGFFIEDPKFSNSKKFALKVTYWKDSITPNRPNGTPEYPAIFPLAHIQNLCAIRFASKILKSKKLEEISLEMKKSIQKMWDRKNKNFYLIIDRKGKTSGISTDALHSLNYLEKKDLSKKQLKDIEESSKKIETLIGYRCLEPKLSKKDKKGYHSKTIWPFEQAIIYQGAKKFKIPRIMKISSRIYKNLDTAPEIFLIKNKKYLKKGCDPQLWTIASKKFFQKELKLT